MIFKSSLLILALTLSFTFITKAQDTDQSKESKIEWITFEEAIEANQKEKKFIFIDVYTEWCGWCKKMDRSTFIDESIVKFMNENFYAVKLDAEQKEDIEYNGNTFKFVDQGRRGYHELAAQLLQGKMSYPSFVILTKEEQINAIIKGYQDATTFESSLKQGIKER